MERKNDTYHKNKNNNIGIAFIFKLTSWGKKTSAKAKVCLFFNKLFLLFVET